MTTLYTPKNNVRSTLATAYAAASGTLTVATGTGSSFGSPSPTSPIRITVVKAANANTVAESSSNLTVFACTGVTGDVLTVAAIEGSTDRNYSVGDILEARLTAGTISDIHTVLGSTLNTSMFNAASGVPQLDSSGNLVGILIPRTETAGNLASLVLNAGELSTTSDTFELAMGDGSLAGGHPISGKLVADIITDGGNSPPVESSLNTTAYNASTNPVVQVQDTAGTGVNLPFMYTYVNFNNCVNLANGTFTAPATGIYTIRMTRPALIIDNSPGGQDPTTDTSFQWYVTVSVPDSVAAYANAGTLQIYFAHGASVFNITGSYYSAGVDATITTTVRGLDGKYPPITLALNQGQVLQWKITNLRANNFYLRMHQRIQIMKH